jgi:hypothetical protein
MTSVRPGIFSCRLAVVGVLSLALALGWAAPARAANAGFLFLIENGLQFTPIVDANGLAAAFAHGTIRPIVNNQADFSTSLGSANVVVWARTVPDPFFNSIGPIAALVTLTLDPAASAIVHLGVIQTPGGLRTTIGARQRVGFAYELLPGLRGEWVLSDGTPAGGGINDLVIGGVAVLNAPLALNPLTHELTQHFPTPPFFYDQSPGAFHQVGPYDLGSFYGFTVPSGQALPARSYDLRATVLPGFGQHSRFLVLQVGAGEYQVMACSFPNLDPNSQECTLSGVGPINGALTGDVSLETGSTVGTFLVKLKPFLVLP